MKDRRGEFVSYNRAKNISEKVIKSIKSKESITSSPELLCYFHSNSHSQKIIDNLTDSKLVSQRMADINAIDKQKSLDSLANRLNNSNKKNTPKSLIGKAAALVGSVAALITITLLVINKESSDKPISIAQNEVEFTSPTLVLPSGEVMLVEDITSSTKNAKDIGVTVIDNKLIHAKSKDAKQADTTHYNKLIVPSKSTYNVVLSDGTEVTLNANTILEYPTHFGEGERVVKLVGEAYFDVSKSKNKFIVDIGSGKVVVHGTQFNIDSRDDNTTEIVLIEGSVGYKERGAKEIKIKPNEKLLINSTDKKYDITTVDAHRYISWLGDSFIFDNHTAYNILEEVGHWYGVKFIIKNRTNNNLYTLTMKKEESLLEVINQISYMSDLTIINEGRGVYMVE